MSFSVLHNIKASQTPDILLSFECLLFVSVDFKWYEIRGQADLFIWIQICGLLLGLAPPPQSPDSSHLKTGNPNFQLLIYLCPKIQNMFFAGSFGGGNLWESKIITTGNIFTKRQLIHFIFNIGHRATIRTFFAVLT